MRWRITDKGETIVLVALALSCGRSTRSTPHRGDASDGDAGQGGAAAESARGGGAGTAATGDGVGASATGGVGATGGTLGGGTGGSSNGATGNAGGVTSSGGASGGTSGTTGGGASGGEAGTPLTGMSCVYLQGLPIDPALGATLDGVNLATKFQDGCAFELGRRVPLPVDAAHGKLLFHYDLNGDMIDDLFFGEPSIVGSSKSIKLLMSDPHSKELKFDAVDCDIPLDITYTKIFARDLDGDGAPDWIVGTPTGVKVFANQPDGLREVGSYEFGFNLTASIQDVATASFDAAGPQQIAVGLTLSNADQQTPGEPYILFFAGSGSGRTLSYQTTQVSTATDSGYVATVTVGDGQAFFGIDTTPSYGRVWDGSSSAVLPLPVFNVSPESFVGSALVGTSSTVAVGFQNEVAFYTVPSLDEPPVTAGNATTYFYFNAAKQPTTGERRYARFLRDLDRDGTSDLVETGTDGDGSLELVISLQGSDGVFSMLPPVVLDGTSAPSYSEDPFLPVRGAVGRVLIRDAEPDSSTPLLPGLESLICEPP
jgi:hypothetical protein